MEPAITALEDQPHVPGLRNLKSGVPRAVRLSALETSARRGNRESAMHASYVARSDLLPDAISAPTGINDLVCQLVAGYSYMEVSR